CKGGFILHGEKHNELYHIAKKIKKPIISRLNRNIKKRISIVNTKSVLICEVPPEDDTRHTEFEKEYVDEWMSLRLFSGNKFFGMISVDKGPRKNPQEDPQNYRFRIIEADRMLAICRSAALALYMISISGIQKVVSVFRHTIFQHL
ncbi:MAG: hypothetical protein JSW06_01630, partial [Thermoplasmatales archaeon]